MAKTFAEVANYASGRPFLFFEHIYLMYRFDIDQSYHFLYSPLPKIKTSIMWYYISVMLSDNEEFIQLSADWLLPKFF